MVITGMVLAGIFVAVLVSYMPYGTAAFGVILMAEGLFGFMISAASVTGKEPNTDFVSNVMYAMFILIAIGAVHMVTTNTISEYKKMSQADENV